MEQNGKIDKLLSIIESKPLHPLQKEPQKAGRDLANILEFQLYSELFDIDNYEEFPHSFKITDHPGYPDHPDIRNPLVLNTKDYDSPFEVQFYPMERSIDMPVRYLSRYGHGYRYGYGYDMFYRMMKELKDGIITGIQQDMWKCILSSGVHRNIIVSDSESKSGLFSERLVSLMDVVAKRNGDKKITDFCISYETQADIEENGMYIGASTHEVRNLGEGQLYELMLMDQHNVTLPGVKVETVVGLDCSEPQNFTIAIQDIKIEFDHLAYENDKQLKFDSTISLSCTVPDNQNVLLGAI